MSEESPPPRNPSATPEAKLEWIKAQLKDLAKEISDGITKEEAIDILKTFQKATFSSKNGGTPQNSAQAIIALQAFLKLSNHNPGSIDGMYGPNTKKALIAFQKKVFPEDKNEWDGIPGPKTIQKIIDSYEADAKADAKADATDATTKATTTKSSTTITLNGTETKIPNVPDDKKIIELLEQSKNAIDKIAFDKDGTLSVLDTNQNNPSQKIKLLKAFAIPNDGLMKNNLVWFRYKEKEGGITKLALSETNGAKATTILKKYPHLKGLGLNHLTSAKDLDLSKNGELVNLDLSGLTEKQVPWNKIPKSVTEVFTADEWVTRPADAKTTKTTTAKATPDTTIKTVETKSTKTITLTLNETTISNVPDDKIDLLTKSANAINKIAFKKDGTLSVLKTRNKNPSQHIKLLKAFSIPNNGLTETNLNWFQYEKESGITTLSLSETDGATATKILEQYPNLKALGLGSLTSAEDLDLSKNGELETLYLSGLTSADGLNLLGNGKLRYLYLSSLLKNKIPWEKIHKNVKKVYTENGWVYRPSS